MKSKLKAGSLLVALLASPIAGQETDVPDAVTAAIDRFHVAFDGGDVAALRDLLTEDAILVAAGGHDASRDAILESVQGLNDERPGLSMQLTADSIRIGPPDWDVAAESGRWLEQWSEDGATVRLAGQYLAMWRIDAGAWRLSALLLIPLQCDGPYCR